MARLTMSEQLFSKLSRLNGVGPATLGTVDAEIEAARRQGYEDGYSAGIQRGAANVREEMYDGSDGSGPRSRHRDSMG